MKGRGLSIFCCLEKKGGLLLLVCAATSCTWTECFSVSMLRGKKRLVSETECERMIQQERECVCVCVCVCVVKEEGTEMKKIRGRMYERKWLQSAHVYTRLFFLCSHLSVTGG